MRIPTLCTLAALSFALSACCNMKNGGSCCSDMNATTAPAKTSAAMEHHHESMWANVDHAVAVVYPTKGSAVSGTIWFDQVAEDAKNNMIAPKVHIHGTLTGLDPNSTHACHIHEFGDASSADGMSSGSHYDPEGTHHHAGPTSTEPHHPGDLGNLTADASGKVTIDLTVSNLSVAGLKNPVVGRALVIHAKADDFSQPVGNAGGRIGVGVIGIAKGQP